MNKHILRAGALFALLILQMLNLMNAQTNIIAHRGFWSDKAPQNSIAALKEAQDANLYGSEFDVLITADGIPVVNHDDRIGGYLIENTPYEKIKDIKLKNGETLPTLAEYLEQGMKNTAVKLILEIKPHRSSQNEDRAVTIITNMVKEYKLNGQVEYISFSLNICKKIRELHPDAKVFYLEGNLSPDEIKGIGFTGIDYNYNVYQKNPGWIQQAKELGLEVNAWTVNDAKNMNYLINAGVDYITTDKPLLLKSLLSE